MEIPPDIQVDFMESQTSQQLEEQAPKIQNGWMIGLSPLFPTRFHLEAQKFRHVSELQLKLSQKLAATEALGFFRIAV